MNTVVVGARGYIGASLLYRARRLGASNGTSSGDFPSLLTLRLDAPSNFDYSQVESTVVFLTAAISSPDLCVREHERAWAVNVTGTSIFIENVIARGGRVVFFSSDTVYGEYDDEFDEYAACKPAGEYAVMKREVERRFTGNPLFKAIRLSYVFSRDDKFTRYLAGCSRRNEEADLFHPFYRAVIHRDDVVSGALALADRWDEVPEQFINFGGPQVLSRIQMAECIRDVHLHDLRFRVTEPDDTFFSNRPRIIAMTSPVLARLLGRPPHSLCEAAKMEFAKFSEQGVA